MSVGTEILHSASTVLTCGGIVFAATGRVTFILPGKPPLFVLASIATLTGMRFASLLNRQIKTNLEGARLR
jgi:hypothetical protein